MDAENIARPIRIRTAIKNTVEAFVPEDDRQATTIKNSCSKSHRISAAPKAFSATVLTTLQAVALASTPEAELLIESKAVTEDKDKRLNLIIRSSDIGMPVNILHRVEKFPEETPDIEETKFFSVLHSVRQLANFVNCRLNIYVTDDKATGFLLSFPRK